MVDIHEIGKKHYHTISKNRRMKVATVLAFLVWKVMASNIKTNSTNWNFYFFVGKALLLISSFQLFFFLSVVPDATNLYDGETFCLPYKCMCSWPPTWLDHTNSSIGLESNPSYPAYAIGLHRFKTWSDYLICAFWFFLCI